MPKYLIVYNSGYGEVADVVEAENQQQAQMMAYQAWREDAEGEAEYRAEPLTMENATDYDLQDVVEE